MREQELDEVLRRVLRGSFGSSEEQEDALWLRFAVRLSQEGAAWAAFAAGMVLLNARLKPAIRSCAWPGPFYRNL